MKRSTAAWTVTVTAAALLALPPAAAAQSATPPTATPQTAEQPPAPTSKASTAPEHLSHARAALNDVTTTALTVRAKTQVAELKRRLTTLERNAKTWGTDVAAMDKILTTLLASDATPTGTSGTTAPARPRTKAPAAIALDDANRAKLMDVRTALTAYAAAMSGQPAPAGDPAPAAPATTTPPSEPATSPTQTKTGQPVQKVDEEAAKRALTDARNTLSALTQLPAAAQLTGDARAQVTQLISNFNELITTKGEWRSAHAKVSANLTALLGPDTGTPDPATSATPGAVGTSGSGMASIDPAVRAKLVELRTNLTAFERASGGVTAAAPASPATPPPSTAPATPPPATLPATPPATPPTTAPAPESAKADPAAPAAHAESMRLIDAIETILKSQDEGGGLTLDKTQADTLRAHLVDLKKLLAQIKK